MDQGWGLPLTWEGWVVYTGIARASRHGIALRQAVGVASRYELSVERSA
jgi:hypothetical protein